MYKFNTKKYLEDAKKTYAERVNIERLVQAVSKKGYKNIIFIGIGGTEDEWMPVVHVMKHYTELPIYLENAAELLVKKDKKYLNKNSLVVTASSSGDTKEILAAVDFCHDKGIKVAGFTKNAKTKLAKKIDYSIFNFGGDVENSYVMFFLFALGLLNKRGEVKKYKEFANQIENVFSNLVRIRAEFDEKARNIANKYATEPYTIFVASGTLTGEAYLFAMCILEEMQWKRTRFVNSSEFFHGTLELVDDDTPVFLFMGEDEYRPLDERVENFCKKYTKKLTVIDTKDYELDGIDDEFRVICSPMILSALVTERLAAHYEFKTGHSLDFRRYYRQFDY